MTRHISQDELTSAGRLGEFVPVYKLDSRTIVKSGRSVRLSEAESMRFVSERTTIPIPQVYEAYTDEQSGMARIVMEYIPGDNLDQVWDTYDDAQKESVISQLRGYMDQLRRIKGTFIGSVDHSWCNDPYFDGDPGAYGPFASEDDFNQGIVKAIKDAQPHDWVGFTCDILLEVMEGHETVMTHNDLDPRNILVRGSDIVALLDWELSGFYPEYWEYCKAMRRPDWESGWVKDRALDKIVKPYRKELSVIWNVSTIIW